MGGCKEVIKKKDIIGTVQECRHFAFSEWHNRKSYKRKFEMV
jgi:hypothetical protein